MHDLRFWIEVRVSSGALRNMCLGIKSEAEQKEIIRALDDSLNSEETFTVGEYMFNAKRVEWIRGYLAM